MTVATSRRGWQLATALVLTAVLCWMVAPTFPETWAGSDGVTGMRFHSWLSPFVPLGAAQFHIPVAVVCAVVACAFAWYAYARKTPLWAPVLWADLAALIIVVGCALLGTITVNTMIPAVALFAASAFGFIPLRNALPALLQR